MANDESLEQTLDRLDGHVDWAVEEIDRLRTENTRLRTLIATVLDCECSTCYSCLTDLRSALKGAISDGETRPRPDAPIAS